MSRPMGDDLIIVLQSLKRDLLLETEALNPSESSVHEYLLSVFPRYDGSSLAAVVALHSRIFSLKPEDLAEACMNFLLDEDESLANFFLLLPAGEFSSDLEDAGVRRSSVIAVAGSDHSTQPPASVSVSSDAKIVTSSASQSCQRENQPGSTSLVTTEGDVTCQPVTVSETVSLSGVSDLYSSPSESSILLQSSDIDQQVNRSYHNSPVKDLQHQSVLTPGIGVSTSSTTGSVSSPAKDTVCQPPSSASSDISVHLASASVSTSLVFTSNVSSIDSESETSLQQISSQSSQNSLVSIPAPDKSGPACTSSPRVDDSSVAEVRSEINSASCTAQSNVTAGPSSDVLCSSQNNNACVSVEEGVKDAAEIEKFLDTVKTENSGSKFKKDQDKYTPLLKESLSNCRPKTPTMRMEAKGPVDVDESSGDTLPDIDVLLQRTDSALHETEKSQVVERESAIQDSHDSQLSVSSDNSDLPDLDFTLFRKETVDTTCKTEKEEPFSASVTKLESACASPDRCTAGVSSTTLVSSHAGTGKKPETKVTYTSAAHGCTATFTTSHQRANKDPTGYGKGKTWQNSGKGKQRWDPSLDIADSDDHILPLISAPRRKLETSPVKSFSCLEPLTRGSVPSPVTPHTGSRVIFNSQCSSPNLNTPTSLRYLGKSGAVISSSGQYGEKKSAPVAHCSSGTQGLSGAIYSSSSIQSSHGTKSHPPGSSKDQRVSASSTSSFSQSLQKSFSHPAAEYQGWRSQVATTGKRSVDRQVAATHTSGPLDLRSDATKETDQFASKLFAGHDPLDLRSGTNEGPDRIASQHLAGHTSHSLLTSIIGSPVRNSHQLFAPNQPQPAKEVPPGCTSAAVVSSVTVAMSTRPNVHSHASTAPGLLAPGMFARNSLLPASTITTANGNHTWHGISAVPAPLNVLPQPCISSHSTKSSSLPAVSSAGNVSASTAASSSNRQFGRASSSVLPQVASATLLQSSSLPASSLVQPSVLTGTSSRQSLTASSGPTSVRACAGTVSSSQPVQVLSSSSGVVRGVRPPVPSTSGAISIPKRTQSEPGFRNAAGTSGKGSVIRSTTTPAVTHVAYDVEVMPVDEDVPIVLEDSQGDVEIVAATPATSIIVEDDRPQPSAGFPNPGPSTSASSHPTQVSTSSLPITRPSGSASGTGPGPSIPPPAGPIGSSSSTGASSGLFRHPGLDIGVTKVLEVFPDADPRYIQDMLEGFLVANGLDYALSRTMDCLLDNPGFPRRQIDLDEEPQVTVASVPQKPPVQPVTVVQVNKPSTSSVDTKDYFKDYSGPVNSLATSQALDRLSMDFPMLNRNNLSAVLSQFRSHYAPSYQVLEEAMTNFKAACEKRKTEAESKSGDGPQKSAKRPDCVTVICNKGKSCERKFTFTLMKKARDKLFHGRVLPEVYESALQAEIDFVTRHYQECDRRIAWALLETEYEEQGQMIECSCCFSEYPFENLVQCFDGHLFCQQCLIGYAKEAIYGSGKLNLPCMAEGCDTGFPKSQLIKALPPDMMEKYDERVAEENLNLAAMPDMVRCPKCSMVAVLDPSIKVLACPNADCRKQTCRDCKADWSEHIGKTCEQLEKTDETKLRTLYEEKMTQARIRTCPRCKAQFFKEEGCNKMTCRCGSTMCYICRRFSINYNHFCQHPRDPGKGCDKCSACSLWTNPEEDEKRAIQEMQREAQLKRREQGFTEEKIIGVPEPAEPPAKKKRH